MVENGGVSGSGGLSPQQLVAGWIDQLPGLSKACADDGALIDLLSELERLKGASAGEQAAATVVFASSQTAVGAAAKTRPEVVRRSVCGQVALARRDSAHRGGRHVGLALALHSELPCTREALAAGRISEWQATLICRETACLDPELRLEADARLASRLGSLGDAGVAREAARIVAELDPAAVAERAAKAARDRRVTVRPAPDTMAYLTALLPAANAVACYAALNAYATLAVGEGDGRGRGQIMADALTERLTGGAITGCDREGRPIRADEAHERNAEPDREPGSQADPRPPEPSRTGDATAEDAGIAGDAGTTGDAGDAAAGDAGTTGDAGDATAEDAGTAVIANAEDAGTTGGAGDAAAEDAAADDAGNANAAAEDAAAEEPGDAPHGAGEGSSSGRRPTVFDPVAALRAGRSGAGAEVRCACSCPCEQCCGAAGSGRYRFPTSRDMREKLVPGPRSAIRFNINVIMSDRTLWGHSDEPADLVGYGPIPADLARDLVAADLGPDVKTFLRRFYTDPDTGQLAAMDSTARFFSKNMKQFLLVRDRECRTPFCHAPARHADHGDDHARGGPTDVDSNGNCRCEACNHTKQAPGWRVVNRPDGVIVTTTPTGHSYESQPPTPPGAAPPARGRPDPRTPIEPADAQVETAGRQAAPTAGRAAPAASGRSSAGQRMAPAAVQRVVVEELPPERRPSGSDLLRLDVVDLSRRFPTIAIECQAA